ncbi:MAG: cytochrome P450 [Verrucomicrobia bacterium]|nr:cytochrome P450 [Verrucomicrobiota bacterium]
MPDDPREGSEFFLNVPDKLDDPFPDLKYFRENHPVFYYSPLEQWFIFDYDNVAALFNDSRLSADRMKGFVDAAPDSVRPELRTIAPYLEKFVLMHDEADHTRIRKFLHLGFNSDAIHALKENIQEIVDELLDRAQPQGRIDFASDLAFLLPAYVLSDLMGFPKQDRHRVLQWSLDFIGFFNNVPITEQTTRPMVRSATEMIDYTQALLEQRQDQPQRDLLSTLANIADADISKDEIVANAMLLLLAGHVAPRNLMGNVVWLLLTNPDQHAKLRARPQLLRNTIMEALRYEPPVTLIPRIALADFTIGGQTIHAGDIVQLSIASANRDESHFQNADTFDITRAPGAIMSFGHGAHGCLGAPLALEESEIALESFFRRMPNFRLDRDRPIKWYRNAANRGPENLPLLF